MFGVRLISGYGGTQNLLCHFTASSPNFGYSRRKKVCLFYHSVTLYRLYTIVTMLYLVGLGLADETDITVKGLEIVKKADRVYLEAYTSILLVDKAKLVHSSASLFFARADSDSE